MVLVGELNEPVTDMTINSAPVLQIIYDSGISPAEDVTDESLSAGWGTEGNMFEYDSTTGLWRFNLKTSNYTSPGTYTIEIVSGDEEEYIIDNTISASFVIQ